MWYVPPSQCGPHVEDFTLQFQALGECLNIFVPAVDDIGCYPRNLATLDDADPVGVGGSIGGASVGSGYLVRLFLLAGGFTWNRQSFFCLHLPLLLRTRVAAVLMGVGLRGGVLACTFANHVFISRRL